MKRDAVQILFVTSSLGAGGAERVLSWLTQKLASDGFAISVIVRSAASSDRFTCGPGVRIVREPERKVRGRRGRAQFQQKLKSPKRQPFRWLRTLMQDIRRWIQDRGLRSLVRSEQARFKFSAVVSFGERESLSVMHALSESSLPVIVHETSQPFVRTSFGILRRSMRKFLYRKAKCVVVLSKEVSTMADDIWPGVRTSVIPNPVIPPLLPSLQQPRRHIVLAVGRLHPVKDHHTLVRAWASSSGPAFGWQLRIVGEGPLRDDLEQAVRELGVDRSVVFAGFREDVMEEYASCSVFVLPSLVEGFSNALVEAMAAGCACIATSCAGGPKEILGDGEFGLLVPPSEPGKLALAITSLIGDQALRDRLGGAAKERARLFAPEVVYQRWKDIITGCLPSRTQVD